MNKEEMIIEEIQDKIISFANDDDYKEHQALFKIGNIEKLLDINRYLGFTNSKLQQQNKKYKEVIDKLQDKFNFYKNTEWGLKSCEILKVFEDILKEVE